MSARQKAWARMARLRLIAQLGGKCESCGWEAGLQFDCIKPTGDDHGRKDTSARMSIYHRQHRRGNLQLLCALCHQKKSLDDRIQQRQKALAEFYADGTVTRSRPSEHNSHVQGDTEPY